MTPALRDAPVAEKRRKGITPWHRYTSPAFTSSTGPPPRSAGIDMIVEDGSFMVILGPSGCGKSTPPAGMIAGLGDISAGEISIDGRVVNDVEPAKRGCAMVFQNYAL